MKDRHLLVYEEKTKIILLPILILQLPQIRMGILQVFLWVIKITLFMTGINCLRV